MACQTFSFKKEAKVYIVYLGSKYSIDVSEINFSQTFTEQSYSVKTIQEGKMFEGSVINKANPANFTVRFPALRENDFKILFDLALGMDPFDIYVETSADVFHLDYCIIESGNFVLERTLPLTMEVSGTASKLVKFVDPIPGTPVARSLNMTYNRISNLSVTIGGTDISQLIQNISIELNNSVEWIPWTSVNDAVNDTIMYPTSFKVKNRTLGGEIVQYLTDTNNQNLQNWSTDTTLHIQAGQVAFMADHNNGNHA